MRYLGIDYGTKRVGVALSDEEGTMAFPHATYPNDRSLREQIAALCAEKGVGTIVLGQSHNLADVPNPVQEDITTFKTHLESTLALPVYLEPEQFSTQAALRLQGRTEHTDASAAALILDAYLTRHRS